VALTATIYTPTVELADVDRGVYETLELRLARHPSESAPFFLTRILAYCCELAPGLTFTAEGISAGDAPALTARDLTGQLTAWIEVGLPDAERLHRGAKAAPHVAVYTHRDPGQLLRQLAGRKIHRAEALVLYSFDRALLDGASERLERRSRLLVSISDRHLYLEVDGHSFSSPIHQHRL
jgi:uncharacterized protein YaeQ